MKVLAAWVAASVAAITLGLPWGVLVGAPFAIYAGWNLIPHRRPCGWCGGPNRSDDWCCDRCAAWHSDMPEATR